MIEKMGGVIVMVAAALLRHLRTALLVPAFPIETAPQRELQEQRLCAQGSQVMVAI